MKLELELHSITKNFYCYEVKAPSLGKVYIPKPWAESGQAPDQIVFTNTKEEQK